MNSNISCPSSGSKALVSGVPEREISRKPFFSISYLLETRREVTTPLLPLILDVVFGDGFEKSTCHRDPRMLFLPFLEQQKQNAFLKLKANVHASCATS